jgi:hypothetical protein
LRAYDKSSRTNCKFENFHQAKDLRNQNQEWCPDLTHHWQINTLQFPQATVIGFIGILTHSNSKRKYKGDHILLAAMKKQKHVLW